MFNLSIRLRERKKDYWGGALVMANHNSNTDTSNSNENNEKKKKKDKKNQNIGNVQKTQFPSNSSKTVLLLF